jgi:hypothetical protein
MSLVAGLSRKRDTFLELKRLLAYSFAHSNRARRIGYGPAPREHLVRHFWLIILVIEENIHRVQKT